MAAALDATIGGTASNSYATVAEAQAYFDERLHPDDWDNAATPGDNQTRALIEATRRIDLERFEGTRVDRDQALKWPRFEADDFDGWVYESNLIPDIVKRATYEMAIALLGASSDPLAEGGLEGFKRVKVGPIEVEPNLEESAIELPDVVLRLLAPVLFVGPHNIRLLRA